MFVVWLMGIVGAKALAFILTPNSLPATWSFTSVMQLFEGGYHLSGGILLGLLTFVWLVWAWQLPFWKCVHLLLWVALPGLAIGRIGCVFSGCCFGQLASLGDFPLLIQYDPHAYSAMLASGPRLPTQLWDLLGLMSLAALMWVRAGRMSKGMLSLVLIGFGVLRWVGLRYRDEILGGGTYFSEWVALFLVFLGGTIGVLWWWTYEVSNKRNLKS